MKTIASRHFRKLEKCFLHWASSRLPTKVRVHPINQRRKRASRFSTIFLLLNIIAMKWSYKSRVVAQLAANNVIKWCHTNRDEFPCVRKLTTFVLCIPASKATKERVFSESGRLLEEQRQRFDSASLDAILFSKHFKSKSSLLWRWFKIFHLSVTC